MHIPNRYKIVSSEQILIQICVRNLPVMHFQELLQMLSLTGCNVSAKLEVITAPAVNQDTMI